MVGLPLLFAAAKESKLPLQIQPPFSLIIHCDLTFGVIYRPFTVFLVKPLFASACDESLSIL